MQNRMISTQVATVALTLFFSALLIIREPSTSQVQAQDRLRIVVEEIQLPVAAYDQFGHFDPSLTIDDLLVLENGTPQQVKSVRHLPANVILLLDTGAEINTVKNIRTTRALAKNLVAALKNEDQVAVMQFNDKVELLQDWTHDFKQVGQVLDTKLLSGRHAHLSDGLVAAVSLFGELPIGSRHLVLITDGVEAPGGKFDRTEALKRVAASNAVIHVISYSTISRAATRNSRRVFRNRDKSTVPDEVVDTLPTDPGYEHLRRLHQPGAQIADVDPERLRRVRAYERAMSEGELQLRSLSSESGGNISLPESFAEMSGEGARAARLIDSGYVVTYKPGRAMTSAPHGEVRRIEVASRRIGLTVVSRRHYVLPRPESK
jgi:VWFA-related protein